MPALYIVVLILILLLMNAGVFALTRCRKPYFGIILAVLLSVILLLFCRYASRTAKALRGITTTPVVKSEICVYVRKDDAAQSVQDTKSYLFGHAAYIETEDVADAASQLEELFGSPIRQTEIESMPALADALLNGEIDAMLIPSAYLGLYADMEGYEDLLAHIRLLEKRAVMQEVPVETQKADKQLNRTNKSQGIPEFFTVYISGIDNRGALIARSRSDVNILAAVNTKTGKIALISVPRDFYVPLANSGQMDKLTHAGIYGVDVSADTVGDLFGVDVDYTFRVNFGGFVDIIDALGGVSVQSDYSFYAQGYSFSEGENYLYGEAALAFCRERHAFSAGDRQRGKNQMAVIKGIINKALSTDMLKNYSDVLDSVEGSFETSVPYDLITALVQNQLKKNPAWDIQSTSVSGYDSNAYCYSLGMNAYVMKPDQSTIDEAIALLDEIRP